jgi:hypothetical protein
MNKTTITVPFMPLLGLAFIVLKLCRVIEWSWLWVLCPLWGPIAVGLAFLLVFVLVKMFAGKT